MLPAHANLLGTCNYCGSRLWFPALRNGELVNCPNCLMETVLFLSEWDPPYEPEKWRLEVRKVEWGLTDSGCRALVGEVVNRSASNLDWARVGFVLFDKKDTEVGMAIDFTVGLNAGAVWRFSAPVADMRAVRASLPVVWSEFGRVAAGELGWATGGIRSEKPELVN